MLRRPFATLFSLCMLAALGQPAAAADFAPGCGDAAALEDAITDAGDNNQVDTITLTADCWYTLTSTLTVAADGGSTLTINGNGGAFNGDANVQVLDIQAGAQVVLNDIMITNGSNTSDGGGISNEGTLTISDSTIGYSYSTAGSGGGVYNSGTLTLTGTTVTVGGADLHGGGIYNEGTLTVSGSTFSLNSSETDDSDVYGDGGAIYTSDTATITGSTFTSNEAQGLGGAIYADGGTVTIGNSTISGNTARSGGGAYLYRVDAAFDIVNTTVSGNTAGAGAGGGIAFDDVPGGLTIRHSTIAGNSATVAGGNLAVLGPAAAGGLFLRHTLVADGTAPGSPDLAGTFDVQFSLIETPGTATIVNPVGNVTGVDPQLGALANNAGPTQTRLPGAASPAVNAGNVAFAPPPTTDQRGLPRVADGRIDIGSVERTPVAPTIAYDPTPGTAVGFTGVTTIGTTGSGTIVATPSGGSGTAAGATTTVNGCTLGGANPGSFAGAAAVNLSFVGDTTTPQNLNLACTSHQTAQTATLTCNETRGAAAPAQRLWALSCPAGTLAPTTSTPVSGSTVNLTGVAGGININTSTITVSNPNPVVVSLTCTAPAFPFTATPLAFSVPASGNAPVTVGISPAAAGTYSGTLSCNVSGSSQVLTFNLAGTLMPAVMVPATSLWSLLAMMLALFGFAAVAARRQG